MNRFVVRMPQLGESVGEGVISHWLVQPGDYVAEFDGLVEVTTDKVDAEVPAPASGVVVELLVREGVTVSVGASIAVIESSDGTDASATDAAARSERSRGNELGSGMLAAAVPVTDPSTSQAAAPLVSAATQFPTSALVAAHGARLDGDRVIPLSAMRRSISERMTLSKTTIPHAWQTQEVDMSGVMANIATHRPSSESQFGVSLTCLPYVLAAAAASLRRSPNVNATFASDHIVIHEQINLGVAVGLPDSVIVPVIRAADTLSVLGLAAAARELVSRAREKRLSVSDVAGATFTINNSGALGTLLSYAVIPPGQSGILTMGAVVDRPVAVKGNVEVRPMMYLCFSLDHRVMDGLLAAEFLGACRAWLESIRAETPVA